MNPLPENHPLHAPAAVLLARAEAPLCPKAPWQPGLLTGMTAGSYNLRALLHLLNDDLEAAHKLVQVHEEDSTANYIHQLVHRREGDWGNTRYWVGMTGAHPFYAEFGNGTARERVDLCQRNAPGAAALAWDELVGLLAWVVREGR
ncbi:hypothetical protein [Armatimonas rosea]|uniref:Uncharacterized protein n=1 Tax=Armatimonas rosea TaxID=685828 RepID=A0A7W9SSM0_ARMRO|nr:hypothetical protein [Armatimonas rosea]MBB6051298.1 hypothetical protein [Armatimonas rosea]